MNTAFRETTIRARNEQRDDAADNSGSFDTAWVRLIIGQGRLSSDQERRRTFRWTARGDHRGPAEVGDQVWEWMRLRASVGVGLAATATAGNARACGAKIFRSPWERPANAVRL